MKAQLYLVIQQILRPLIHIMLSRGVSFREFNQIARSIYVEQATHIIESKKEKATNSRIAIRTGLTRKDVAQLRKPDTPVIPELLSGHVDRGSRVINGWLNDPDFQPLAPEKHAGKPPKQHHRVHNADSAHTLALPLNGTTCSFETLVRKYSGDMPYRAVLKELISAGLVKEQEQYVILMQPAYLPRDDEAAKLQLLGTDVALLINTIAHNLQSQGDASDTPVYFQRKVCYDNLPADAVAAFRALAAKDSMQLLLTFNEWLRQHEHEQPPEHSHERHKAGIGIYYFEESQPPQGRGHD